MTRVIVSCPLCDEEVIRADFGTPPEVVESACQRHLERHVQEVEALATDPEVR